ncbi:MULTISPECIES: DUF3068 domain-containing protein [unclassified Streptomyces]|uniref:DUF3068 domain-containing protein n=1 Tax=unclassified Streptomyces TaxID=2593676 RepID=UPI0034077176
MRRQPSRPALALLAAGAFLLTLAPLFAWYVTPHVKRTPIDVHTTTVSTGRGSYFDAGSLAVRHDQTITITRHVLGDVAESERSGRAVWDISTTVDTPRTLPLADPHKSLQWSTERWVTDRRTNAPVHCCAESRPPHEGDAYLKFPFDLRKGTYRWWDATLAAAIPLRYAGTREVLGHQGYRYTGTVAPTRIGTRPVPAPLVGLPGPRPVQAEQWYANPGIDLIVDRRTGRVLDAVTSPRVTLRGPGQGTDAVTLLRGDELEFTPATQRQQVDLAREDGRKLLLVGTVLPLAAGGTGAVLAVAGTGLMALRWRRPRRLAESADPSAAQERDSSSG